MASLIKSFSKCPTGIQNVKTINPYVPRLIKPSTFAFNTKSMIRHGARFRSDSFVFFTSHIHTLGGSGCMPRSTPPAY